jgi:hypothetical protein
VDKHDIELFKEFLASQEKATEILTDIRYQLSETTRALKSIDANFKNGFRAELKSHTENVFKTIGEKHVDKIISEIHTFKSAGFWIKIFVGFIIAVAGVSAAVLNVVDYKISSQVESTDTQSTSN